MRLTCCKSTKNMLPRLVVAPAALFPMVLPVGSWPSAPLVNLLPPSLFVTMPKTVTDFMHKTNMLQIKPKKCIQDQWLHPRHHPLLQPRVVQWHPLWPPVQKLNSAQMPWTMPISWKLNKNLWTLNWLRHAQSCFSLGCHFVCPTLLHFPDCSHIPCCHPQCQKTWSDQCPRPLWSKRSQKKAAKNGCGSCWLLPLPPPGLLPVVNFQHCSNTYNKT